MFQKVPVIATKLTSKVLHEVASQIATGKEYYICHAFKFSKNATYFSEFKELMREFEVDTSGNLGYDLHTPDGSTEYMLNQENIRVMLLLFMALYIEDQKEMQTARLKKLTIAKLHEASEAIGSSSNEEFMCLQIGMVGGIVDLELETEFKQLAQEAGLDCFDGSLGYHDIEVEFNRMQNTRVLFLEFLALYLEDQE